MMLATRLMLRVFAFEVLRIFETELVARQFGGQNWWLEFGFCKWFCKLSGRVWSMIFRMACLCVDVLSSK